MITGDSRQKIIPPARSHVKAGFVVYSPSKGERSIIILNEGELVATDPADPTKSPVFKMHPGDLVGVASLLEREPLKYTIEATTDSDITLVNEDCMESELKTLPVWLLAVIKKLSSKTRKLKAAFYSTIAKNTIASLSEYCSHLPKAEQIPLTSIIQEFCWLTRIKESTLQEDVKALARRKFINLLKTDKGVMLMVPDPFLLQLFVDYQNALDKGNVWPPFGLSVMQKQILVNLSSIDEKKEMDAPAWLAYLKEKNSDINVGEWLKMQKLGWFTPGLKETFRINKKEINYFLTALCYEANIKGVL